MLNNELFTSVPWTPLALAAAAGTALVLGAAIALRHRATRVVNAWNAVNAAVGTHDGVVTRQAQTAISSKHLLGTVGSNGDGFVQVASVSDAPLYVMPDEAAEAGDPIACIILGAVGQTVRMAAADEIGAGSEVFVTSGGKVEALPDSPGTYFVVGRALTSTETDGDLLEVASCVCRKVVIAAP